QAAQLQQKRRGAGGVEGDLHVLVGGAVRAEADEHGPLAGGLAGVAAGTLGELHALGQLVLDHQAGLGVVKVVGRQAAAVPVVGRVRGDAEPARVGDDREAVRFDLV